MSNSLSLPSRRLLFELQHIPGISQEAAAGIELAGFSSVQQLSESDPATLQRIPSVTPEIVDAILGFVGATVRVAKPRLHAPGPKDSLLADVDDELLREFEGMFEGGRSWHNSNPGVLSLWSEDKRPFE